MTIFTSSLRDAAGVGDWMVRGLVPARRPEKQQQVLRFAQDDNIYFDEVLRFAQDDSFYL